MIAGIDIGTSSVKVLCYENGEFVKKVRVPYEQNTPENWLLAIKKALAETDTEKITEIGFSSQVGTQVINDKNVISWNEAAGKEELDIIKKRFDESCFSDEISMPHPDVISYPIPRIMYAKKHYAVKKLCQPKDFIINFLTGNYISDIYSWRGLANIEKCEYSKTFLDFTGISAKALPRLAKPPEAAGYVTDSAAKFTGLKKGTAVYTGMNDFFASLLGMGMLKSGQLFDITGTSEHLGTLCKNTAAKTKMISSPYIKDSVIYGVTASSGISLETARKRYSNLIVPEGFMPGKSTPIFLPYLKGERAPIFDVNARGVFFGIDADTCDCDMAYAVSEGVVFSIYHIYENLSLDFKPESMIVSGGAANNDFLNQLKANVFDIKVKVPDEKDTSAAGAVIAAIAGSEGISLCKACDSVRRTEKTYNPVFSPIYRKRFEIYKNIYKNLKTEFKNLKEVYT